MSDTIELTHEQIKQGYQEWHDTGVCPLWFKVWADDAWKKQQALVDAMDM